jgi:hypothetical protein
MELDTTTDTLVGFISTPFAGDFGCSKFFGGALGADGRIYAPPSGSMDAGGVRAPLLIIDPLTRTVSADGDYPLTSQAFKWHGAVSAPNGKVYGIPAAMSAPEDTLFVINPNANAAFSADTLLSPYYNHL